MTTKDLLRQEQFAELATAIHAEYPNATELRVSVIRDENNRGYFMAAWWCLYKGEALLAQADEDGEEMPFDQELNNWIDDQRETQDFILTLKEKNA